MRRPLLLLIAATAGVASVVILAAAPNPSSRVTTQTANPQTAADLPASGVADTPSDSSAAATQASAQSVAVSSDPSASSKAESSTATTTTTTLAPEPTPTSLAPEPLGVELVADTRTNADTNADTKTAPAAKADTTEPSEEGQVYVWYDGDRTRRVRLQSDQTVQTGSDGQSDAIVARSAVTSTQAKGQALPVFRSESSDQLMTLPGGVLVMFDPELDDAQISKFLTEQGISKNRVTPMLLHNAFEIVTEPGQALSVVATEFSVDAEC